jgi:hypothetical protein
MKRKLFKFCILFVLVGAIFASFFAFNSILNAASEQEYTFKNVEIVGGGYVPGIIFNESEENLIYARTDIGGAYRWNESSSTWENLTDWIGTDDWNYTGILSLATDPVDTNRVYLAAGTYTNSWTSQNGAILRSSDKGESFEITELPFKLSGNMPGRGMGERLAIDPNDNSILYLGAPSGNGLWKSTDYGETWSEVAEFPNPGNFVLDASYEYTADNIGVVWVTFDEESGSDGNGSDNIYVGVADVDNSIYRSTDGGESWERVDGQPTGYLPHHGTLGSNGNLYISYSDSCGPYDGTKGEVWKLDTSTDTWTDISPVESSSDDNYFGFGGLAVDKQNPDTLMVTTLNSWWPDANIYRSTDGGESWNAIWEWAGYPSRTLHYNQDISDSPWLTFGENAVEPEIAPKLGWMIGDIDIDPFNSDRMMYGTGATVYGSENLTNWDSGTNIDISVMAEGIEETAVKDLVSPPEGANLYSCLLDISGFKHDDLDTVPDMMMLNPNISCVSMDYAENSPSFMVRVGNSDDDTSIIPIGFSYDNGTNWFQPSSVPTNSGGGTVAAASDASCVVWSPIGGNVNVTTDNGSSWTESSGIPSEALVESDRVNPDTFYGFSEGTFYVSTDGGLTFSETASDLGSGKFKAIPGIEGDIWLATSDGLKHSTDNGSTFTTLSNVTSAECVGFGMAAPGEDYMAIFISGEVDGIKGIFRSDDAGDSWIRVNDDDHQYAWTGETITGDPRIYGRVYISTNGRGIIYGDIAGDIPTSTATETPTATETSTVTDTATETSTVTPTSTNESTSVSVDYNIASDWGSGATISVTLNNNSTSEIDGWTIEWTFSNDEEITNMWSGDYAQSGQDVIVTDSAWNNTIPTNGSVNFGFNLSYGTNISIPSSFTVNGIEID